MIFMGMLEYRELGANEKGLIEQIDATCHIQNAWRMNADSGAFELTEIDWTDHELPNGLDWHIEHFARTVSSGGKAFGCFDQGTLVGYATLGGHVFGMNEKYVLLDQLFVSEKYRGKGIGKELVSWCSKQAVLFGAEKLYICAGSSEDTIAFYERLGCRTAAERDEDLFREDPNDIQLELKI